MRITSWSIIFVLIVFAFSFSNRMLANNKMDIVKEEVRYNNALDLSTMDATTSLMENMINLGDETNETFYTVLSSVDRFFDSFSLTLGYYGGEEKQTALKTYIPVVAVLANEGVYMCSLENLQKNEGGYTYNYAEHTVKPKIPYAVEDKTPMLTKTVLGADKIAMPPAGVYINYTMGNMIKVYDPKTKEILQGSVVDTRHYKDITEDKNVTQKEILSDGTEVNFKIIVEDDVYSKEGEYKGQTIYYEKTFYYINGVRYLYEEWYIEDELVDRRSTEYTEDAYNFTKRLETVGKVGSDKNYYELEGNYLTQGNPENTGKIDPFTGIYTIGEYNRIKNEAITEVVKEQLSTYTVLHNRYLEMQNITYTFALPDIDSQDWERAINDVSVFAFVQGIPLVGEQYYNNYGLAGAQIVDREIYYGWPGERYVLWQKGIKPGDDDFPVYYSSYDVPKGSHYLLEANGARIYYSAQSAALEGYFPNIHSNNLTDDADLDVTKLNIELEYRGNKSNITVWDPITHTYVINANPNNNQTGQFGVTGTTTYDPITLTYLVNPGSKSTIYLNEAKYAYSDKKNIEESKNRILNVGTEINLENYNPVSKEGTFEVNKNGTYIMAAREYGGATAKSNDITINVIESGYFNIETEVTDGYKLKDSNGRRYGNVEIIGYGTPIFSEISYERTDGKAENELDEILPISKENVAYGDNPKENIHIYDSGEYKIEAVNGYGDKEDTATVDITIPNLPPIVELSMEPTQSTSEKSIGYDNVIGLTVTRYIETNLYEEGKSITIKAKIDDEDRVKKHIAYVDKYTTKWTHYYKAETANRWSSLGVLNASNDEYTTKDFQIGMHRVYVTATDIYGESTTSYIEFIVTEPIIDFSTWYFVDRYADWEEYNSLNRKDAPFRWDRYWTFTMLNWSKSFPKHRISTGYDERNKNYINMINSDQMEWVGLYYEFETQGTKYVSFDLTSGSWGSFAIYINSNRLQDPAYTLYFWLDSSVGDYRVAMQEIGLCKGVNRSQSVILYNRSDFEYVDVSKKYYLQKSEAFNVQLEISSSKLAVVLNGYVDGSYELEEPFMWQFYLNDTGVQSIGFGSNATHPGYLGPLYPEAGYGPIGGWHQVLGPDPYGPSYESWSATKTERWDYDLRYLCSDGI